MIKAAKAIGLNSDIDASLALIHETNEASLFMIASCGVEDAFSRVKQGLLVAEDSFTLPSDEGQEEMLDVSLPARLQKTVLSLKESLKDGEYLHILVAATTKQSDERKVFYLLYDQSFSKPLEEQAISEGREDGIMAYLIRDGKGSNLCQVAPAGELISGFLKPNDRILLTTASLNNLIEDSVNYFRAVDLGNFEQEIVEQIPQSQPMPLAAILVEEQLETPVPSKQLLKQNTSSSGISPKIFFSNVADGGKNLFSTIFGALRKIPNSRNSIIAIVIIIVALSCIGYFFFQKQQQITTSVVEVDSKIQLAEEKFQQAKLTKDSDFALSVANLEQAKIFTREVLSTQPDNQAALQLSKEIEAISSEIFKLYKIDNLATWLDLNLIKQDLKTENLSLEDGKILILDNQQKVVVEIDANTKAYQLLAGADKLGQAEKAVTSYGTGWVYSGDKGAIKIDGKQMSEVAKPDSEWQGIVDIAGFAGNLYLLDRGNNQIWKYLPIDAGYSEKTAYFEEDVSANLSNAKRIRIDASIWVLTRNGSLLKYTYGRPDQYQLPKLDIPLTAPTSFFVAADTENVYILDADQGRIIVTNKTGEYQYQYTSDQLVGTTDLAVAEKDKKAFLVKDSTIYHFTLR